MVWAPRMGTNMKKRILILAVCLLLAGCGSGNAVEYDLRESTAESLPLATEEAADSREASGAEPAAGSKAAPQITVYICGEVACPGVYTLPEGSRVYVLLEAAGGLLDGADERHLNQAQILTDGQQITVYSREETAAQTGAGSTESAEENGSAGPAKVNLNLADKAMLMTLPGIGEAKAEAILNYRNEHGGFASIEEIQNISGIKERMFERIKDLIEI